MSIALIIAIAIPYAGLAALGVLYLNLKGKIMATDTKAILAALTGIGVVLDKVAAQAKPLSDAVAQIGDSAGKIIDLLKKATGEVPQEVIDGINLIASKASEAAIAIDVVSSAPGQLDQITSLLNAATPASE